MSSVMGLYPHNEEAYQKVDEAFNSQDVVGIVHATGTGKSYIALELAYKNKDKNVVYVVPSEAIKEHIIQIIEDTPGVTKEDFSNLNIITYQSLVSKKRREIASIPSDLLILDEFHHTGAPVWGKRVNHLIKSHEGMKVFGMTAYTVRDRGTSYERDMANPDGTELFSNKIVSLYGLDDAILEEILPVPIYKTAYVELEKILEDIEEKMTELGITPDEEYETAKKRVHEAPGTEELIRSSLKEDGKYIYFCPPMAAEGVNNLDTIIEEFKSWYPELSEDDLIIYKTTSEMGKEGKRNRDAFYNDKTLDDKDAKGKLRVMFCINQYNEGVHAPNVDGVILGRGTKSDILFFEQLGRALAVNNKDKNSLVIDLTNNYDYIMELQDNITGKIQSYRQRGDYNPRIATLDEVKFDITALNSDLFKLLTKYNQEIKEKYDKEIGEKRFKERLIQIDKFMQEHNGELPKKAATQAHTPDEGEKTLGTWIKRNRKELPLLAQRQNSGKHAFSEYEEAYVQIAQNIINSRGKKIQETQFKESLTKVDKFMQEHNGELPKIDATQAHTPDEGEKTLGMWIGTNRKELPLLAQRKDGKFAYSTFEEKYVQIVQNIINKRKKLDKESLETQFKESLTKVDKFMLEHNGELPKKAAIQAHTPDEGEKTLGDWINTNREELPLLAQRKDGKFAYSTFEEKYVQIVQNIINKRKKLDKESLETQFKESLTKVDKFMLEHNGELPKKAATQAHTPDEGEKTLGIWIDTNRKELPLLAQRKDGKFAYSTFEEKYVQIVQNIINKRKKLDKESLETQFKESLTKVDKFMQEHNGELPKRDATQAHTPDDGEKTLGTWIKSNRKELPLLAQRQNSGKHAFSEYEEAYVQIAIEISLKRGWIQLEEAKKGVPNEQAFTSASNKIINGTPKTNNQLEGASDEPQIR